MPRLESPAPERADVGDVGDAVDAHPSTVSGTFRRRLRARRGAIVATVVLVVLGMLGMLEYLPLIRHHQTWDSGLDIWGIFRAAHYVGWGDIAGVYQPSNGVLSFPGMPILMAPVAMLSGALHLTESSPFTYLAHPTADFLIEPFELLLASLLIFAADAVAESFGVGRGRRAWLDLAVAAGMLPVTFVWGHAEDAVAVALALYALLALVAGRWKTCGWLFGAAILMQPLAALLLPLALGATPRGQRLLLTFRASVVSAFLLGVCFVSDPTDTYQAVVVQPGEASLNHPTPWLALAPRLADGFSYERVGVASTVIDGRTDFVRRTAVFHGTNLVAGGPGRTIDVVLAVLVGLYVWRRPQSRQRVFWLAAALLASRCWFEAVMTPYYLAGPLVAALVVASARSRARFWGAVTVAAATSWLSYESWSPWAWWTPMVVGMVVVLWLARPGSGDLDDRSSGDADRPAEPTTSDGDPDGAGSCDATDRELVPTA